MTTGLPWRRALLLSVLVMGTLVAVVAEPVAQDPAYHLFADKRLLVGIPNFFDVMSNLPFAVVGFAGLYFIARNRTPLKTMLAWQFFFAGIFLTAFGSGYYHLAPSNETLVWDRLPMTIAFMSFVTIIIDEYLSRSLARRVLVPLLIAGAASVFYWAYTEAEGRGDLRAYALVQFLPLLLIPMIVLLYQERSGLGRYIGWMIVFYIASKLLEFFDAEVFTASRIASGHSLKHVFAAMAPACLLYGLWQRRYHAARP